jgi:acetoin utilization protein AcuC
LARFIGGEIYRLEVFKAPHPLAMPRAMLVRDLVDACFPLDSRDYLDAAPASPAELAKFHTPGYIAALMRAEATQDLPAELRERTRIGADANVIHQAVFRRPATSAGAALLAADLAASGQTVHAPSVGNHHAFPDHASGFCFINDIALLILRLRALGFARIAYLDLDAHHGDGVEAGFADDPAVLTISVHEAGRWPRTGTSSAPARAVYNFSVPAGFNDCEMTWLWEHRIQPLLTGFAPDIILFLPGADALADDTMSKLALSNNALWDVLRGLQAIGTRLILLGGGGYNPYALARCWAGLWAILNHQPIPAALPAEAEALLEGVKKSWRPGLAVPPHWTKTMQDAPREGAVRDEIKRLGDL